VLAAPATPIARVCRPPAAPRVGFAGCLLVVVCAHWVLLSSPAPQATAVTAAAPGGLRSVQVRHIAAAAPRAADPAPSPAPQTRKAAGDAARVRAREGPGPQPTPDILPPPDTVEQSAAEVEVTSTAGHLDPYAGYLPRSALTIAPRALTPVVIDYPRFDGEADFYSGEFDLFIDDDGSVARVAVATPDLPGILGDAVHGAFMSARFAPGELEGRPVRARIRIEVTFDSRKIGSS
jgi:protein TonB